MDPLIKQTDLGLMFFPKQVDEDTGEVIEESMHAYTRSLEYECGLCDQKLVATVRTDKALADLCIDPSLLIEQQTEFLAMRMKTEIETHRREAHVNPDSVH